jgi:hypothetical protein
MMSSSIRWWIFPGNLEQRFKEMMENFTAAERIVPYREAVVTSACLATPARYL